MGEFTMSAGGPPKVTFSDKEYEVFLKVYKKLQSDEWDVGMATRFFKGNQAVMSKYNYFANNFEAIRDEKLKVLYARREESGAKCALLFSKIEQIDQNIVDAREKAVEAITAVAPRVTMRR